MTATQKKEIVDNILNLLIQLTNDDQTDNVFHSSSQSAKPVEMLTIKECTEIIQGLSEHTVRQLVAQGKVKSVRTGEGKRGKILVNKADLIAYFQK
ncbi:MAG: helix-turn-helix domain-containing protein [Clostridium sp.]|nr:helix-turn-helix domain-containing protein [Clostridium sp.]